MVPSCVAHWMRTYREKGESGLVSRKATGRPPTLVKKQQTQLYR